MTGQPLGERSSAHWRRARPDEEDALLELMRAYYAEDGYPFREHGARAALARLLREPERGAVFVAEQDDSPIGGYAVLTVGYSLEYLGLDAFVDELYLTPAFRGRGLSRGALAALEAECLARGVGALHLEVERDKAIALDLYRRRGFVDHDRFLMTKRLR